jgi:adenine phosphoribosyltransferase
MDLARYLRNVPDFPKPGITFKDITPLLGDAKALRHAVDSLSKMVWPGQIDRVAAVESRGFLFGAPLAVALGVGFTPIRKPGKLPWRTTQIEYALEYGTDRLQVHVDGVEPGQRVLLVDDLLATGGTMRAACDLVENIGGRVIGCGFVVELAFLGGRAKLPGHHVQSLVRIEA